MVEIENRLNLFYKGEMRVKKTCWEPRYKSKLEGCEMSSLILDEM